MKLTSFVIAALVIISPLGAFAQEATPVEVAKPVPLGNKVCPVSGQKIMLDSGMNPVTVEYKSKIYNLCCTGCVGLFKADPEKYSKIADDEVAKDQEQMKDAPTGMGLCRWAT